MDPTVTVMSVKTDKKLKTEAQNLAKKMGFPLGTLVNAFLRQFVRNKIIYFTVGTNKIMTKTLEAELEKIEKDMAKKENVSPKFDTMEDALAYLKKG